MNDSSRPNEPKRTLGGIIARFLFLTDLRKSTVLLLVFLGLVAGAANTVLLATIGQAIRNPSSDGIIYFAVTFAFATALFLIVQRYNQRRTAILSELSCANVRTKIVHSIFYSSLSDSEGVDSHVKRLALSRDAPLIASALTNIVALMAALTTSIFAIAYLFFLAPLLASVILVVILVAILLYHLAIKSTVARIREAYNANDLAFRFIDDLLNGHKELKVENEYADEFLHNDLLPSSNHASKLLGRVRADQQEISLIGAVAFLLLLGSATFIAPVMNVPATTSINVLLVLLFIQTYIHEIVARLPALIEVQHSMQRIDSLMAQLDRHREDALPTSSHQLDRPWTRLRLENVSYSYPTCDGTDDFHLSNINLSIPRGQIVFIVGGNGSGKTTLAEIILGLYSPLHGSLFVDDIKISDDNLIPYRRQFTAVFSDIHLFPRHLGEDLKTDQSLLEDTLSKMKLKLKLSPDGRMDTAPYSRGQKKRLACALAMHVDKSICLFDEWTADQDPEFRVFFYDEFLPNLKSQGKTLIVITHDDRFFDRADMVVFLDRGQVRQVSGRSRAYDEISIMSDESADSIEFMDKTGSSKAPSPSPYAGEERSTAKTW